MKTEKEIEENILTITMKIQKHYPGWSKYLVEMPVSVPDIENPEINSKNLQDYHNSLLELLDKYVPNQDKN